MSTCYLRVFIGLFGALSSMKKYFKPISKAVPPPTETNILAPAISQAIDTICTKKHSLSDPDKEELDTAPSRNESASTDNKIVRNKNGYLAPIFSKPPQSTGPKKSPLENADFQLLTLFKDISDHCFYGQMQVCCVILRDHRTSSSARMYLCIIQ